MNLNFLEYAKESCQLVKFAAKYYGAKFLYGIRNYNFCAQGRNDLGKARICKIPCVKSENEQPYYTIDTISDLVNIMQIKGE